MGGLILYGAGRPLTYGDLLLLVFVLIPAALLAAASTRASLARRFEDRAARPSRRATAITVMWTLAGLAVAVYYTVRGPWALATPAVVVAVACAVKVIEHRRLDGRDARADLATAETDDIDSAAALADAHEAYLIYLTQMGAADATALDKYRATLAKKKAV